MKLFIFSLILTLSNVCFSQVLEKKVFVKKNPARDLSLKGSKLSSRSFKNLKKGSLPLYMRRSYTSLITFKAVQLKSISLGKAKALNIKQGDILFIKIEDEIIVYKDNPSPIRAKVLSGRFKNATLLGKALIDKKSKRVFIDFHAISPLFSSYSYPFKGVFQDMRGRLGLRGEHYSSLWLYMSLKSLSDSVSYKDKGLSSGLKVGKRYLNQKIRQNPEYVKTSSYILGQVLILEKPTQNLLSPKQNLK